MKANFSIAVICIFLMSIQQQLAAQTVPTPDHVVVVVMENHGYSEIIGASAAPYINSLAADPYAALFTNSLAITHPSQPNYLYLYSGSSQSVIGDIPPFSFQLPFTTANLGAELLTAGKTFTGYCEDLPSVGFTGSSSGNYVGRHAPWSYWMGTGTNTIPSTLHQPYTSFPTNYNNLPTLSFVIPNLQDDMHDGTITQGDTWLQTNMDAYIQWAKTHNSLLILTFDEDENTIGNSTPITTIFIGQMVKAGRYNETVDHNRMLRTMEDMYGLTYAGASSTQTPITDCWVYKPISGLSAAPLTICPGQSIQVLDSSRNAPLTWTWSFPGGTPATYTGQNPPPISYSGSGTYDIKLVTYNHMGYDTLVRAAYVTVNQRPTISVNNSAPSICAGDTASVTATGASSFHWLQGAGQIMVNGANMLAAPGLNATYYVTGTTNGCQGDTASVSVQVTAVVVPTVSIQNSSGQVCTGGHVLITSQNTNGGVSPVYSWRVNGNVAGTDSATFSSSALSNNDVVTCVMTSTALCARPDSVVSNSLTIPLPPFLSSSVNASICNGDTYSFKGGNLSAAGTYLDTLVTVNGCDSIVTLQLTVNNLPVVSWTGSTDTVNLNAAAITLAGASPAGGSYAGTGVAGGMFNPATAGLGTFVITYTYTDGNGCINTATKTFVVNNPTGVNEMTAEKAIAVYPNPALNSVTLESVLFEGERVFPVVYDVLGRVVPVDHTQNSGKVILDPSHLSNGVYWVRVSLNGTEVCKRFVKGK